MLQVTPLDTLVPIAITGKDARNFMQAQITCDLKKLTLEQAIWGAKCSPQGRVQMLLMLLERPDAIIALFQALQAEDLLARLNKGKFAAKIAFEHAPLVVAPVSSTAARTLVDVLPSAPGGTKTVGEITALRWWGQSERYLLIAPPSQVEVRLEGASEQALAWRRDDVATGVPQVYPETNNAFVPQNLNLDLLSGVAYDKGCYIGQEVVARAKRNGVPRRMLAFSAACAVPPPGTTVLARDSEAGHVVDAVPSTPGCELLAVVETEHATATLTLAGFSDSRLTPRPLPYDVPLTKPEKPPSRLPAKASGPKASSQ